MGDKPEKFSNLTKTREGSYHTKKMPKEHSLLDEYILNFADDGLYEVYGITDSINNDAYGIKAKGIYNKLKAQLTEKYGKPICAEKLFHNSIWKDENDFSMSIFKNERVHFCEWSKEKLKDNLELIKVAIIKRGQYSLAVGIVYKYINSLNVEKQKLSKEKDSL